MPSKKHPIGLCGLIDCQSNDVAGLLSLDRLYEFVGYYNFRISWLLLFGRRMFRYVFFRDAG